MLMKMTTFLHIIKEKQAFTLFIAFSKSTALLKQKIKHVKNDGMFSYNFSLFGWGIKLPQNSKENNHQCSNTTGTSFKPGTSKILFKSSLCHIWYFPDRDIVRTSYTFYHRFTNRIFANDSLHLEFTDRNTLHKKIQSNFFPPL